MPPTTALDGSPSETRAWALIFAAWLVAGSATLGALFFSEVMDVLPCVLCWYQRVCMFPLAVVLAVGLFPLDVKVVRYALPLAVVGALVGLYHLLLLHGVVPEPMRPCTQGVPCSDKVIEWAGFVSLPLLSTLAFCLIIAFLLMARRPHAP